MFGKVNLAVVSAAIIIELVASGCSKTPAIASGAAAKGGHDVGDGTVSASTGSGGGGAGAAPSGSDGGPAGSYSYPLRLAPGKRYLVDQLGTPFLLKGDAGWAIATTLNLADATTYLSDRARKGFNTIWIGLIDNIYAANASTGANAYGELPFLKALDRKPYENARTQDPDFSTPNEAYFKNVDQVLALAASYNLLVLLSPAWLGSEGGGPGTEGYYNAMVKMPAETLQGYGQFLGRRYANFKNIIWHHSGDFNPPNKTVVENIVIGLKQYDTVHLGDVDTKDGTSPMDYWSSASWLDIDNVYSDELLGHPSVYQKTQIEYQLSRWKPLFMKEGAYEGEHASTNQFLRSQAYQGILCGGFGEIFGNNPIWLFANGWQAALASRGSLDMVQLHAFFTPRRWDLLVPDFANSFVVNGASSPGTQRVAAARASDGSWGAVYVPNQNAVTLDLSGFAGPVSASWMDPTTGAKSSVSGSPFGNKGPTTLSPPAVNGGGDKDWVLLVEP